jgi:hypothetical protein
MKKTILFLSVIAFTSCQKTNMVEDESEESISCEVVTNETVPDVVQNAFTTKYPQTAAEKWFNKDNKGFSALFMQNGNKTLAQFDNNGTFRTEIVNPPVTDPSAPSCNTCPPPKQKCGKRPHKRPPFLALMKKKRKGSCNKERKEKECEVVLSE